MVLLLLCLIVVCLVFLFMLKHKGSTATVNSSLCQNTFRPHIDVDIERSEILNPPLAQLMTSPYYLVIDTETFDAIDPNSSDDQGSFTSPLVALSWQLTDLMGTPIKEESLIIRQRGVMEAEAIAIHGITNEQMAQGIDVADALQLFCQDLFLVQRIVAHNAHFHISIIRDELCRLGLNVQILEEKPHICTMLWGRELGFKVSAQGHSLYPTLSELFGYLYYGRMYYSLRYTSKTLRDIRLCSACLRYMILRAMV